MVRLIPSAFSPKPCPPLVPRSQAPVLLLAQASFLSGLSPSLDYKLQHRPVQSPLAGTNPWAAFRTAVPSPRCVHCQRPALQHDLTQRHHQCNQRCCVHHRRGSQEWCQRGRPLLHCRPRDSSGCGCPVHQQCFRDKKSRVGDFQSQRDVPPGLRRNRHPL